LIWLKTVCVAVQISHPVDWRQLYHAVTLQIERSRSKGGSYFSFARLCVSASLRETSFCNRSGSRAGATAQRKRTLLGNFGSPRLMQAGCLRSQQVLCATSATSASRR